jgi:hypothetical protein
MGSMTINEFVRPSGKAWRGTPGQGLARLGEARPGWVRHGMGSMTTVVSAWRGLVRRGEPRHGMVRLRKVGHGAVRLGSVWRG